MSEQNPIHLPEIAQDNPLDNLVFQPRYNPRIVALDRLLDVYPFRRTIEQPLELEAIQEILRRLQPDEGDEPPVPVTVPVQSSPSPAYSGYNDAYRLPNLPDYYDKILPDYADAYNRQQILDVGRYPFQVKTLPETGLPRYVNGVLPEPPPPLESDAQVQEVTARWRDSNLSVITGSAAVDGPNQLEYLDVVRNYPVYGEEGGQRGIEIQVAHARYQQYYNRLPVYGGGAVLTLTRDNQHLSVTNSFLPIPDELREALRPLTEEEETAARPLARAVAHRVLMADEEFAGVGAASLAVHLLAPLLDEPERVWGEGEDLLLRKLWSALRGMAERAPEEQESGHFFGQMLPADLSVAESREWLRGLMEWREKLAIPAWDDEAQIVFAPYRGSDLVILPFDDSFYLTYRLRVHTGDEAETWQLFVDARNGVVRGDPEPLAAHALSYIARSAELAAGAPPFQDPALTLGVVSQQAARFCQFKVSGGAPMTLVQLVNQNPTRHDEAVNIGVHANRLYDYFVDACGVDTSKLQPAAPSQPVTLLVGRVDPRLAIKFDPGTAAVIFQSDTGGGIVEGNRRILQPSMDPEVIYHELVHALMWRLNGDPFEIQQHNISVNLGELSVEVDNFGHRRG